jgi:hypothetical protein
MRLGGFDVAEHAAGLARLCVKLDEHRLSAIQAPGRLAEMSDEECAVFGETAKSLDLVVAEALISLDRRT